MVGMRVIYRAKTEFAAIDFVHYRQMLSRLHQKRSARVARKRVRILGMLAILDIRDRAHFFGRGVADNEPAALERKLALALRDHRVHARAAYRRVFNY